MKNCFPLTAAAAVALMLLPPGLPAAIAIKKEAARKRAPAFELQNSDGKTVQLSDYAGKVVLLDLWATWCTPCKNSIPWMIELADKYREAGLAVVGVSMDEDGWPVIKPFMDKMKITYPVLQGNKRIGYLYGDVDSLPLAFFLDRSQRVAAIHLGAASRKDFEKTIQLLLDGGKQRY